MAKQIFIKVCEAEPIMSGETVIGYKDIKEKVISVDSLKELIDDEEEEGE